MTSELRFLAALVETNVKACLALRGAFWLQVAGMALNNALFFVMWWILFDRFEEIRGWRLEDMLSLYGVVAAGFGLAVVLGGGIRDLARTISDGDLDPMLTQPRSVVVQAVAGRSLATGWGDFASGVVMVGLSGYLAPDRVPVLILAIVLSASTVVATGVLLGSAAFWASRVESLARMALEYSITFSLYPPTLFHGPMRIVLFTLVPAGFIGYLPASLLREFEWTTLGLAICGVSAYGSVAAFVFGRGPRMYASGSRFGVRV